MPSHQERREPLPDGYQFGDAAWRAPHLNAAATLQRFHDQQAIEAQLADTEPTIEGVPV